MSCREDLPLHSLVTDDIFYDQLEARLEDEDPNQRDRDGNTLLHNAAMSHVDNSKILELLIKRGAVVDSKTPDGSTPLHLAVINRQLDAVVALIKAGASINLEDNKRRTALHFSISLHRSGGTEPNLNEAHPTLIRERLLCRPEINLNPVDEAGETPLMLAVKEGDSRAVEELLKKSANPNLPDKNQRTPLHVALSFPYRSVTIANALLTHEAGIYSVDNSQLTPIDILVRNVHDNNSFTFALFCVHLIALRYRIEKSLEQKLDRLTQLKDVFKDCCREVRLMKRLVIYGNVTLHDFCINSFPTRPKDAMQDIFLPVLQILLTGVLNRYNYLIFFRLSNQDWHSVLKIIVGESSTLHLVPNDAPSSTVYNAIKSVYLENTVLKAHIIGFTEFLKKEM